ncbi:apolipophorins [Phlebotomus argentipes]|uniref:apolipophorins n=1 Tax=Phlebotomus argentipes TaxID=94469 RepID=UPI0028935820|nr:apolipophorins [Phlebotomus argentipes]
MARGAIILFVVNLLAVLVASAAVKDKCHLECLSTGNPVKLQPGHTYTYNVESVATVLLAGVDGQETRLRYEAEAKVFAQDRCTFFVSLAKIVLQGADEKRFTPPDLAAQLALPTRFALGSPSLCAHETDSPFSLNLKRAVASSFVNGGEGAVTDVDLFGRCPSIVSVTQTGGQFIVNRARNLNQCSDREILGHTLTGSVFNEASAIKSTPSLSGDYNSEVRLKNGVVQQATVSEEYRFLAFATNTAGVRAKVATKLSLTNTKKGTLDNLQAAVVKRGVTFETPRNGGGASAQSLRDAVRDTVNNMAEGVSKNATAQFVDLVRLLRDASKNDIKTTFHTITTKSLHERSDLARKVYLDALFRTATGDSVEAIIDLMQSRQFSTAEQRIALLSMSLVTTLNRDTLQSVIKLTPNTPHLLPEALMTTGTLVRKYCEQFGCTDDMLDRSLDRFTGHLHQCNLRKRRDEDMAMAALKGARNTHGNLGKKLLDSVVSCANKDTKMRLRVAAVQALTGICHATDALLNLLEDMKLDPELRIEAYLALTHCPTNDIVKRLQTLLDGEKVQQVGAFINSHLAAVRSSTDPSRQMMRSVLGRIQTQRHFPFDLRRFSHAREFSYAVDSLGLGASVDAGVIYSHGSFLPRSLYMNATGELFGNSFNLFDATVRQGNLEKVIENYLGPRGILMSKSPQQLFDYFKSTLRKLRNATRVRRDVKDDVKGFAKNLQLPNDVTSPDLDLDVSIKFLGNEMLFLSLGDDFPVTPESVNAFITRILNDLLDGANKFHHNFQAHALFVDGELSYPTAGGLPLRLAGHATGVVGLEASGSINLRELFHGSTKAPVQLRLVPSANVAMAGSMVVDAFSVTAGLQVEGSLHSSTASDVRVAVLNSPRGADIKVMMPRKKQEIFSLNHDVVFYQRERGHQSVSLPLRFTSKRYAFSGCFDQLHRYTGVTFCTDYNVTIPGNAGVAPFPFNGANRVSVWLEVDSHYHFAVTHSERSDDKQFLRFAFDTPNSTDKRSVTFLVESATKPNIYVRAELESSYRHLFAEAGLVNNEKEVALYAIANDQSNKYEAKVGFTKDIAKREYKPILQLTTPNNNNALGYSVDGTIGVFDQEGTTKYDLRNLKLNGGYFTKHPVVVYGSVTQKGMAFDMDLKVTHNSDITTVTGALQIDGPRLNFNMEAKGGWYTKVVYKMSYEPNDLLNHLELDYGRNPTDSQHVKIKQQWRHLQVKYHLEELSFANELELSQISLKTHLNGDFKANSLLKWNISLEYGPREMSTELHVLLNEKTKGDYSVTITGSINRRNLSITARRVVQENASKYSNRLSTSTGLNMEANGVLGHKISMQEADVVLDAKAQFGHKQQTYLIKFELKLKPQGGNTEGSLSLGKTDIVTFRGKLKRQGSSQSGDLQIAIKEILEATGDFSATGGNGTATLNLDVKKLAKAIKILSTFTIEAPTYNVATEVIYDGKRAIRVDSHNHANAQSFSSHNDIEVLTERYVCNVKGSMDGKATDGVITGAVDVTLPTGRKLSGSVNRELKSQGENVRGSCDILFSDRLPSDKTRSLAINSQLVNSKWTQKLFQTKHTITYKNLNGQDVTVKLDVNHKSAKGNFRSIDGDLIMNGSLFTRSLKVTLRVPDYSQDHANFNVAVKSDKDGDFQVVGRYVIGGRAKASEYDIFLSGHSNGNVTRTIEVKSSGSFLSPQVDNGVYDTKWNISVVADGKESGMSLAGVANEDHANVKIDLKLHERDPVSVSLSYNHESLDGQTSKCSTDAVLAYAKDKKIHARGSLKRSESREVDLHLILDTPYEHVSSVVANVKASRTTEGTVITSTDLTINEHKYGLNSALVLSDVNPSVDLVLVYPKQEVKFYAGFARVGEQKYNGKVKVTNLMEYNVDMSGEISVTSIDNFFARANINAPKFNLKKSYVELKSKHQGGTKGVEIIATNDGKTVLTGIADYTVDQNRTFTVFEAKGNVNYMETESAAHLKFIHHTLTEVENQETGVSFIVNAQLGPKSIVGEFKLTDKNIQLKHTACEKQRQCINLDVQSTIFQSDLDNFRHQVLVSIDLRKLGYSHEFGLKAETNRTGVELDHTIEMHLQAQDKPKYQYSMYLHSRSAGIIVGLPERTIALEGVFQRPESFFGIWDISANLHLDKKNKPHEAMHVGLRALTAEPREGSATFESSITLTHPAVSRNLTASAKGKLDMVQLQADVNLIFDIFKTHDNQIVLAAKVINTGKKHAFNVTTDLSLTSKQGLDYQLSVHAAMAPEKRAASFQGGVNFAGVSGSALFYVTPTDLEARMTVLDEDMFVATAKLEDSNRLTASATLQPIKSTPINLHATAIGLTEAKVSLSRDKLINITGEFAISRLASLTVKGHQGDIFVGQVTLDQQHFLASSYQMNRDKMKLFLQSMQETIREDFRTAKKEIETHFANAKKRILNQIGSVQKSIPDLNQVVQKFKHEISSIVNELEKDPSIKPVIEVVARVYGVISKALADVFQVAWQNLQKLKEVSLSFYGSSMDIFNERILPSLVEWYTAVEDLLQVVYLETVQLVSSVLERITKTLKDYEEDFNKIAKISTETVAQLVRGLTELLSNVKREVMDIQRLILDYMASLPGVNGLKEKWNALFAEYNIPEQVISLLHEFRTVVRDTVPNSEVYVFIESIVTYIEKKLQHGEVNDLEMLRDMYAKGVIAMKAIIHIVRSQPSDVTSALNVTPEGVTLPFSLDVLRRVPYVSSIKISALKYLRHEPLPSIRDLLDVVTPGGRVNLNLLPPFPLVGHVVDGQHVFTFDGRHFTFPGSCTYILARDALHGNFTVLATLTNGHMTAVTLLQTDTTVQLTVGGAVKMNDKPADLPIHQGDLHVWRRYYTVTLLTNFGAEVMCTTDLVICHISVNGFYHNRLRGWLGNGNGEPQDDFQLPSGIQASNYADFGNSYSLGTCQPVDAKHEHGHHVSSEPCTSLFTGETNLRIANFILDPTNFHEACEHAVMDAPAAQKTQAACNIVSAYVSAARLNGLPLSIPDKCLQCSENRKPGQQFSTRAPTKQADVVLVIDTSQPHLLTEFAHQLTVELRKELRAFDIADVNIAVIGFQNHQRYPSLFTHNGKLDVHGKLSTPREDATTPRCDWHLHTGHDQVDEIINSWINATESLINDLGLSSDARAFQEAMAYPFRAKAAKIIFAVRSDSLSYSSNPSKMLTATFANSQVKRRGIQLHLLTPVADFTIIGKDVRNVMAKDIVGFSSRTVINMEVAKKRVNPGQTAWRKAIRYTEDLGMQLVQDANGFVFILNNYQGTKQKKQFVSAVATAVADNTARHEMHMECECRTEYGLHAEEKCIVSEVKVLKQVTRMAKG